MTVTATDLFCGAGGSSLGAERVTGLRVEMAANHWSTAIQASVEGVKAYVLDGTHNPLHHTFSTRTINKPSNQGE